MKVVRFSRGRLMDIRNQKQIIMLLDFEIVKEIKKRAIEHGITMKRWVLQAVIERMAREDRARSEQK